jgi:uncharacterized surface protein with fasciclin (FAS1) repeats
MKHLKINYLIIVVFALFVTTSCETEENANHKQSSLTELVSKNENLTLLSSALTSTGLDVVLSSGSDVTLLAPTNAAFNNFLAENGYASLNDIPTNILRTFLLNHVINTEVLEADLPTNGYFKTKALGFASTTNNLSIYFRKSATETRINGEAVILNKDIQAQNGVIHTIDRVLKLPTIVDHAVSNPNLSSLVSALTTNGSPEPDFVEILSGVNFGPYTVIAPMNVGFSSLLTETGFSSLSAIPPATLTKVLKYHVLITSNTLSNSLTNDAVFTTYNGDTFKIQDTPANFRIKDFNNRLANFTTTDIQCYNGVIHMTDKVLLPNLN